MEKLLDRDESEDTEDVFDGITDIAEWTKSGKKPPRSKGYRILINGKPFVSKEAHITGREVLTLGGKTPPENFTLRVKLAGHKPEKLGLDEVFDLRRPGVEKFKSLPKDQTEGLSTMAARREFNLLPEDLEFLESHGLPWETINSKGQWVLLHDFPTHDGYNHSKVTVAIRLETGYPQSQLDMAYFFPKLARKDGKAIGQTQANQVIDGQEYQRWSRHRTPVNPWIAGEDNLGSHIFLVEDWLEREFEK